MKSIKHEKIHMSRCWKGLGDPLSKICHWLTGVQKWWWWWGGVVSVTQQIVCSFILWYWCVQILIRSHWLKGQPLLSKHSNNRLALEFFFNLDFVRQVTFQPLLVYIATHCILYIYVDQVNICTDFYLLYYWNLPIILVLILVRISLFNNVAKSYFSSDIFTILSNKKMYWGETACMQLEVLLSEQTKK